MKPKVINHTTLSAHCLSIVATLRHPRIRLCQILSPSNAPSSWITPYVILHYHLRCPPLVTPVKVINLTLIFSSCGPLKVSYHPSLNSNRPLKLWLNQLDRDKSISQLDLIESQALQASYACYLSPCMSHPTRARLTAMLVSVATRDLQ